MAMDPVTYLALACGMGVGLLLGLIGGGGSILAVPLLIYAVGVGDTHLAIGTASVAVAFNALFNLIPHARAGSVKWRCAAVFALFGIGGAAAGSTLGKLTDGDLLLALFGLLMIVVGIAMGNRTGERDDPEVRLSRKTAAHLLPRLGGAGLGVGGLSGFFGIGGGFLILPGLVLSTRMPLLNAVASSLVAVAAFGATTATNYALSGQVAWTLAGLFIAGGLAGGYAGSLLARRLGNSRKGLQLVFAVIVIGVGLFIAGQGGWTLYQRFIAA